MEVVSCPVTPPPPPRLPSPPPPPLPITTLSQAPLPPPPLPAQLLPSAVPPPTLHTSLERDNVDESGEVQHLPQPRSRMRRLQWTKIPANRIAGRRTLWTGAENVLDQLDFERMEELFALPSQGQTIGSTSGGKGGTKYEDATKRGRARIKEEINVLDSRRSLNVNVFLRQFRMSHSDLIQLLARADSRAVGCEKLRGLLRILPTEDEVIRLKSYASQRSRLGNAERFCLELMDLPSYAVKVEAMLVKEEFLQTVSDRIRPALGVAILSVKDLNSNMALHEILHMVLMAGNFLNSGASSGNAAGFRLSSLLNLTEIRSNKPKMTLLHYVAWEAEKKKPQLLQFPEQLSHLKECSEHSLDSLKAEVHSLTETIASISEKLTQTESEFQQTMAPFIKYAKEQMVDLEKTLTELESLRLNLAAYLCEEESTFKLDECIKVFQTFCEKFSRAVKENKERSLEEKSSEKRRKSVEAPQIHRQLRLNSEAAEDEDVFVGTLLSDSALHNHLSRRSKTRNQSVSDFGRICDSYMITGDECNCSKNDDRALPRQSRNRTLNTNKAEPSSCLEPSEEAEEHGNSLPSDRVEPLNDRIPISSIVDDGYNGPIYCSAPNGSDQIVCPPVDVSDDLAANKIYGKRNSKSRLRRFASSFEDGRERIYSGERDFGQGEIPQEKSEATRGDLTGRRKYQKANSVDGANRINIKQAESFPQTNGEGVPSQFGDNNKFFLDSFYNGGQKVCLERIGVRIGLELSSPVGAKVPFGVTDATFTVSVSKSGEEKDSGGADDARQLRNIWGLNSEMKVLENSGETSDKLRFESPQGKGMEKDLLPKCGTTLEVRDQNVNIEQSVNELELLKKGLVGVNPVRRSAIVTSDKETHPNGDEFRMKGTDVDVSDPVIAEDNPTCGYSDNTHIDVQHEITRDPMGSALIDNIRSLTDNGYTENPTNIIRTMQCEDVKADYNGTKNSDLTPPNQLTKETFELLGYIQHSDGVERHDQEIHQTNDAGSLFYEKKSEDQRAANVKPKLSLAMKNRLQELSNMYSESDNEDWYSSSVKKTEPIDGIRKGTLKGTLICDVAKLSEFLCSSGDIGVRTLQEDDQVKKDTKIPSKASSRKTNTLSSAAEDRSTLPRLSSSSASSRRNTVASNTTPSTHLLLSSPATKRVAKPVMPRTQSNKVTDVAATKAKAEQKRNPQRLTNDSKDASSACVSRRVISVASPLTERKEIRKPGQTSVFTRLAAPKTTVPRRPSPGVIDECASLRLYIRTPAASKILKTEESKSLHLKPSFPSNAISHFGKIAQEPCSAENRQRARIPSASKASNLNLLDSNSIAKPLSPMASPKAMLLRGIDSGGSKQLLLRQRSMDSNSSSDLLHTMLSKNLSRKAQSRDANDNKAVASKFDLQQYSTLSKASEDHPSSVQGPERLIESKSSEEKQSKLVGYRPKQLSAKHQLHIGTSQSLTSEYQQQCPSSNSEVIENPKNQNTQEQLRTTPASHKQGQKLNTYKDQSTECPPISKPTAKVAPMKIGNASASALPRRSSAKPTSRQPIRQS